MYREFIFKDPSFLLASLVIAVFIKVIDWVVSLPIFSPRKKINRYFILPSITAIEIYIITGIILHTILPEFNRMLDWSLILGAIFVAIIIDTEEKLDDISPRNSEEDSPRTIKYYIDKFFIHATSFHKLMYLVYGICLLLLIIVLVFVV